MSGLDISYAGAVGAGLISFLSPCVLPLVPAYLSYMAGTSLERMLEDGEAQAALTRRVFVSALAFVIGFSTIFIAMGASGGPQNKEGCWERVLKALERDHVEGESIGRIVREIAGSGDTASVSLLKTVLEKNPSKKIQAKACKGLMQLHEEIVAGAERLKRDEEVRRAVEKVPDARLDIQRERRAPRGELQHRPVPPFRLQQAVLVQ